MNIRVERLKGDPASYILTFITKGINIFVMNEYEAKTLIDKLNEAMSDEQNKTRFDPSES